MSKTNDYNNAIGGQYLDGLKPQRHGNLAESAAHLLIHYMRMGMDGKEHPYPELQ